MFVAKVGLNIDVTAAARDIREDYTVVALKFSEAGEQLITALNGNLDVLITKSFDERVEISGILPVFDQQNVGRPQHMRERGRAIVLGQDVIDVWIFGNEFRFVGVEVFDVDCVSELEGVFPWR